MKLIFQIILIGFFVSGISTFVPSSASSSGDEWNAIKSSLADSQKAETQDDALSNLEKAKSIYENVFRTAALEVDPESDLLITDAFSDSTNRIKIGDIEQASLNVQIIDKTIYKIAFMKMELAIEKNVTDDFLYWYDVMEKKFKLSEGDYDSNALVRELQENPATLSENGPKITKELIGIFKLKTIEELEEAIAALEKDDLPSAKKFTYEGLYYYRTFHPAVVEELGQEDADELLHEMNEALEVTQSKRPTHEIVEELRHISSEVELLIRDFEGGNTSELGLALSGIKDRLSLVDVEYSSAVKDGQIIDQEEYDETVIFLAKAIEIFDSNQMTLQDLSGFDASALENNLSEINKLVTEKANPNQVTILVGKSLNNVSSLQDYAGGETEIDVIQYIDEIEELLTQAKQEYRNGNSQIAFDLVTEAYLDNYEFVEGPLGDVDPELMEKIEVDMREELRAMIQSNKPVAEVDAQIDMILSDLEDARMVVPEFGTIAAMILALSVFSVILLSAKYRQSIFPRF